MTSKFVHAADIHLDSPLTGLERHEGAPVAELRGATRRAFENLIELCLDEQVAFLVIAGDLYDGDWKDFNTGLFFVRQMGRLRAAGIPVYIARGNHDSQSTITRTLLLPENVHVFDSAAPQTFLVPGRRIALHGRSYPTRAVQDDLSLDYPRPVPGHLNIGVLHTCASGRDGHEDYAPCNVDALRAHGYDYWALGHVHTHEVLSREPWVLFSGNIQGRSVRERGPRGCVLVSLEDGAVDRVEHRAVDVLRWTVTVVDVSACETAEAVVACVRGRMAEELARADERMLAMRVVLGGATEAHAELQQDPERWKSDIVAAALDEGVGQIWVERVLFETRMPLDFDALRRRQDPLGSFLRGLETVRGDDEALAELATRLNPLIARLPSALHDGADGVDFSQPAVLRKIVADIEQLLVPRMLAAEEWQ